MKLGSKIYLAGVVIFALIVGFILTAPDHIFDKPVKPSRINHHWTIIKASKTINAITHNNSTGYFIYKGRPMGFQYDLLKEYCLSHGFSLNIIVEDDLHKAIRMIKQGKADILAIDLTLTKSRKHQMNLTEPHGYNHQVLLQRRKSTNDNSFVDCIIDLEGKKVHIQKGTVFKEQLEALQEQTGTEFEIIEDEKHTTEELMVMVSEGEIDYSVGDERPAMALKTFLPNLDFSLKISPKQKLTWALPPYEDSLLNNVNSWLTEFLQSKEFNKLERKYFTTAKASHQNDIKNLPGKGGNLTPFDDQIKKASEVVGWDWRMMASLIYQESRFNPETVSWAGACGLMQVMPETAKRMGVEDYTSIEGNLIAGARFLKWLDNQLSETVTDSTERIYFVLAAYNCGLGHILDAQQLADKYGKNPGIWTDNTDTYLLLKSQPKYYHDKVVKHGFCRGIQTYEFVLEITERYRDYVNLISEG